MSIELSVVIPTCQRRECLRQVLRACSQQSLPSNQYEVIVSIDGSTDATEVMLAQLRTPYPLRWKSMQHAGAAAARNQGAALAEGIVVLFIDDDIVPTPHLFAEHLAAHGEETKLAGLGQVQEAPGRLLSGWERYLCSRYQEHYHKLALPGYRPDFWDCLSGNLSLDRQMLAQSGGFDTILERHEDIELGYRLSRLGARFAYLPQALGYHRFARSVEAGSQDAFREGVSAMQLAERHHELTARLIHARWGRYAAFEQALIRQALAHPFCHAQLAAAARALVKWVNCAPLAFAIQKPFYQITFHLHFWQGVRAAIGHAAPLPSLAMLQKLHGTATPAIAPSSGAATTRLHVQ